MPEEEKSSIANEELIEALADQEHASWARWMRYLFSQCEILSDGRVLIPSHLMGRWARQSTTPYAQLSEREKQSDRDEVMHILPIILAYMGKPESAMSLEKALAFKAAMEKIMRQEHE